MGVIGMKQGKHAAPASKAQRFLDLTDIVIIFFIALGIATAVRTWVCEPYVVPSGSMEETILIQDRILAEKISIHVTQPARGDILTFNDPNQEGRTLVKRTIGLPGDVIDFRNGSVYVNGEQLIEPYTTGPSYPLPGAPASISYPFTVPEGTVWMMGDNREHSGDSRIFGPVALESITARAFAIYWPMNHLKLI